MPRRLFQFSQICVNTATHGKNSFRSASTMPSVTRRMCHVDRLGEVKDRRSMSKQKKDGDDHHVGGICHPWIKGTFSQWLR